MISDIVHRAKRVVRWLKGEELLCEHEIDVPTLRLGSDYGGWVVAEGKLDSRSTVYSFGVGRDVSFDVEIIARYGLEVHAFDPTPRSIQWCRDQSLPVNFVFHPYGISNTDGNITFHPPEHDRYVSYSSVRGRKTRGTVRAPVHRLETILATLDHDQVDLLKMDIEGAEYDVLADILDGDLRPVQLLVEFHHRFSSVSVHQTKDMIDRLHSAGYRIFSVSPTGEEYSFLYVDD